MHKLGKSLKVIDQRQSYKLKKTTVCLLP